MKKTEAISILATSVRPREPKDRTRYDEAVKMAIEALKSSEQAAESAQNVLDGNLNWAIPILSNLMPASVVTDAVQNQIHLEESAHRIKQLTDISIDDLIDLLARGYELKAPSAQPEPAIPLQWIEAQIEWLKSLDNAFSTLTAGQISAMVNKWKDEQDG